MKEFDENEAVAKMCAAIPADKRDNDSVCEVLDLIYDFYDENGMLDFDLDDDDSDDNARIADIVAYIEKMFARNAPATKFTTAEITAMVTAETDYEDSLL